MEKPAAPCLIMPQPSSRLQPSPNTAQMLQMVRLATTPTAMSSVPISPGCAIPLSWLLALGALLLGCTAAMASLITGQVGIQQRWHGL